jgi:hypothetical protein
MSSQDWQARLVASLCHSKQDGRTFDAAWAVAVRRHPPSMSDDVVPARALFDVTTGERELSIVESMRVFCEDAWFGRRPALEQFTMSLLQGEDETRSARRGRSMRRTA